MRCRTAVAATLFVLVPAGALADQWLVYIGGGIESIAEKGWKERRGQVLFTQRGGTLVSVPFDDVDLPTSAFITWQMNGRRSPPPRVRAAAAAPEVSGSEAPPCEPARVVAVGGGETLEVMVGDRREIVHLACLDAPETRHHRVPQLAWFGRAAVSWLEIEAGRGGNVCLTEHVPELRDGDGHRIVHVRSEDGRDYAGSVISGGMGLLRPGACDRAADYSALEARAIAEGRGLWGARAEGPAFAAVGAFGTGSAGPTAAARGGALPPRRSGGG